MKKKVNKIEVRLARSFKYKRNQYKTEMQTHIDYLCSFNEDDKKWDISYKSGVISITSVSVNIQLNYPPEEVVMISHDTHYREGKLNSWSDMQTRGFTFRASTRSYMNVTSHESNLDKGEQWGKIEVDYHATGYSGAHYLMIEVPYLVAKGFIDLMSGRTELEGVSSIASNT